MTLMDDGVGAASSDSAIGAAERELTGDFSAGVARRGVLAMIGRRLGQLLIVIVGVSFITFVVLNLLPGDPAVAVLGEDATPEALAAFRDEHELDRPLIIRYLDWFGSAIRGDLGQSYTNDRDVRDSIRERLPVTVELVILAQVIALVAALPAAILAVRRRNTFVDRIISLTAFAGLSIPSFLFAYLLILVFAVKLQWLPATGFTRLSESVVDNLRSVIMPSVTLALAQYAVYLRVLRSEMLDTQAHDFVTTAHGKGLSPNRVLVRHVLRGSLFSLITVVGVNIGTLLGGAVLTETVFAIPGIGRLLMEAISRRDLMLVQGVVLFIAVCYVVINLVVDLLYSYLDPRIRHGHVVR